MRAASVYAESVAQRQRQRGLPLFTVFGFHVRMDWTWIFLAMLVVWSLATGYFPHFYPGLRGDSYWFMAIIGALGLFGSIVLHELCHSLVGRIYDLRIEGIRLFIFGGIAEMKEEPASPKAEFFMAVAGPVASVIVGLVFLTVASLETSKAGDVQARAILEYLSNINFILAGFNLVPAFPLDGGRILRSTLWWWKGDLRWATRWASALGIGFGYSLIGMGFILLFQGAVIGGIWFGLIGFFIQNISRLSYYQLLFKDAFQGEAVVNLVDRNPVTVSPDLPVTELIDNYFYRYYHKLYPVLEGDALIGCVGLDDLKAHPKETWPKLRVAEIMRPVSAENSLSSQVTVAQALKKMADTSRSRFLLLEGQELVGVITLGDFTKVLSVQMDLEGEL